MREPTKSKRRDTKNFNYFVQRKSGIRKTKQQLSKTQWITMMAKDID